MTTSRTTGHDGSTPRVDNRLDQALGTTDEKKRKEIYEQVQEIIEQDAPVAFLNYYVQKIKGELHDNRYKDFY